MRTSRKTRIKTVRKIKLHCIFIFSWLAGTATAQLAVYPLEKKSERPLSARTKAVVPISLPFWDDFSFVTENHAVDSLWVNNAQVLVGDGQAINPPTIHVATFDGLNQNGAP